MKRTIHVCLGDGNAPIGELRYDRQGRRESAAFAYASDWIAHPDRFAVDPALPLVDGFQFHHRTEDGSLFHGAIADTAPDGWGRRVILRAHARRREAARVDEATLTPSREILGELDFLLAVDDESRVGALRFRDESGVFQGNSGDGRSRTPPMLELPELLHSTRAVEASTETARDLAYLQGRGTSLGGLRPKCVLRDDDGHLAICKFPSISDERKVTIGEVLALRLAQHAGINAAVARIVISEGSPVAVVRRFDRTRDGRRIPYISAATMLGVSRDTPEEAAYTDIVDALRVHGHNVQEDIHELFRRIAFSICINNVDDHLHNHGFLHVGHGQWRLAPAFDINPFPDRVRELKTWISPETGPAASLSSLLFAAGRFGLSSEKAQQTVDSVRAAVSKWRQLGADLGMSHKDLDTFADAFL